MTVIRHPDPHSFAQRTLPMLMRNEAVNNWMVGLLNDLCNGIREVEPTKLLMLEVRDNAGVTVAAAASTGQALVMTDMTRPAIEALVESLAEKQIELVGVAARREMAETLSNLYVRRAGMRVGCTVSMFLMQLAGTVRSYPVGGTLRLATEADIDLLTPWARGFSVELGLPLPNDPRLDVTERIGRGRLYVWCDPHPVSMAGVAGPTPNGIRINFVYTPPEFRGQGYARACVSSLTKAMLDAGRSLVFLYVDANNSSTNRLYGEIEYKRVCDWVDWRYDPTR